MERAFWKRLGNKDTYTFDDGNITALKNINIGQITYVEITCLIKKLKNNKAAGINQIPAEAWKSDIGQSVLILKDLHNKYTIWVKEGIIV